ncbi:MAG: hypothetical protein EOO77_47675, partial [Oxalobacteraceae bacterium]
MEDKDTTPTSTSATPPVEKAWVSTDTLSSTISPRPVTTEHVTQTVAALAPASSASIGVAWASSKVTSSATALRPAAATTVGGSSSSGPEAVEFGEGPNTIRLANRGPKPENFAFFANAGPFQPDLGAPYATFALSRGGVKKVLLPKAWSGRLQKLSGTSDDAATWGEFAFDGYLGLTFFDVSFVRGNNGGMLMRSADGNVVSGTADDLIE